MPPTPKQQAAIAALLAALAAGGGSVTPDVMRSILVGTCKAPETRVDEVLPTGEKTTTIRIDAKQAVNLIGQLCRDPANPSQMIDTVELKLISKKPGGTP